MGRALLLCMVALISLSFPSLSAQGPLPSIVLECDQQSVTIEVHPGSSKVGNVDCTLSNPSVHALSADIIVSSGNLSNAAPGSVTIASGGGATFQVALRGESTMSPSVIDVAINASVTTINGVPCTFGCPEDSADVDVEIVQFARISAQTRAGELNLGVDQSAEVVIDLQNLGNGQDVFEIEIENQSGLETLGFTFDIQSTGNLGPQEKVPHNFTVMTGGDIPTGTFEIEVYIRSSFDPEIEVMEVFIIQAEGPPEPLVNLGSDETALVMGGLSVAGLILVVLIVFMSVRSARRRRLSRGSSEKDEWSEVDEYDDFDDLDDFM